MSTSLIERRFGLAERLKPEIGKRMRELCAILRGKEIHEVALDLGLTKALHELIELNRGFASEQPIRRFKRLWEDINGIAERFPPAGKTTGPA
ncbi:MAG: hypothetical protein AAB597_02705 [Patescibacteria group bacterium]